MAELIGLPLLPWARTVADTALEVDPRTGRLAYREVVLTVPRQSAKTTLCLAVIAHRMLAFGGNQRAVYTAQTRADARLKFTDDWLPLLDRSALAPLYRTRLRAGAEGLVWRTGSIFGLVAPNEDAGHSKSLDLAVLDECWTYTDSAVEQGVRPTMLTRPEPQLWYPSTAGTDRSTFLRGKVDAGRTRCKSRRKTRTAYFEWSADPDADPADPATWYSCMPALGHLITEDTVQAEYEGTDLDDFRRSMLNVWIDEAPRLDWDVIAEPDWQALHDPSSEIVGPVAMALDITPERSFGSIAVAGRRRDGRMHVELADHRPGTGWMVDRAREVAERHRPCVLLVDAAGPCGSLILGLEAVGLRVTSPNAREVAQACGAFLDACDPDTSAVRHLDQGPLTAAVAGARLRPLSDASAWARRGPTVAIAPLVACTLAAWGHVRYAHLADRPTLYVLPAA